MMMDKSDKVAVTERRDAAFRVRAVNMAMGQHE